MAEQTGQDAAPGFGERVRERARDVLRDGDAEAAGRQRRSIARGLGSRLGDTEEIVLIVEGGNDGTDYLLATSQRRLIVWKRSNFSERRFRQRVTVFAPEEVTAIDVDAGALRALVQVRCTRFPEVSSWRDARHAENAIALVRPYEAKIETIAEMRALVAGG